MLSPLSILSPDQGKLTPPPVNDADWFARFAQDDTSAASPTPPTGIKRLAQSLARWPRRLSLRAR